MPVSTPTRSARRIGEPRYTAGVRIEAGERYDERFEIVRLLGTGAFGQVYEVKAPEHDEPLALKLSHDALQDDETGQRARREVLIQSSIESPAVPKVYEHGTGQDGRFFMLMELIDGVSLNRYWRFDKPMAIARAIDIVLQVCEALDEIHQQNIVHRDLKPANIFVQPQTERVYLIDFGLARSWHAQAPHGVTATAGHMLVGTPHYAQPEQIDGVPLTPAADVYSLALILYELLTAHTPFDGHLRRAAMIRNWKDNPARWIAAHLRAPVRPPSFLVDEIPRRLDDILAQCLAKDPAERPQSAGEFAALLDTVNV